MNGFVRTNFWARMSTNEKFYSYEDDVQVKSTTISDGVYNVYGVRYRFC